MTFLAIVAQELRSRMRSGLTYVLLTTLVLAYGILALAAYWLMTSQPALPVPTIGATQAASSSPFFNVTKALLAYRGTAMLLGLGLFQGLLMALVCPAIASG